MRCYLAAASLQGSQAAGVIRVHPQVLLAYGSPVAAALPRRWAESLAEAAGDVAWRLSPQARSRVDANLRQVLGRPASADVRRSVFRSYARYYLGMMRLAHRSPEQAMGRLHLDGAEAMQASLARRRGAVILSGHMGHWDAAAIAVARRFGRLWVYVEPLRPPRLLRFYTGVRRRHGVNVMHAGEHSRAPFAALGRNEILGMVVDRAFGSRVTEVPFGRGSLLVPTGGIRLALRLGAGIHPVFALRQGRDYRVELGEDLSRGIPGDQLDEGERHVATAFAQALRRVVARFPEQWCLLQPLPGALRPEPNGAEGPGA